MTVIDNILNKLVDFIGDIFFAILIIFIGFKIVDILVNKLKNGKRFANIEKSNQTFILSIMAIGLKIIVSIISITVIGIPMSTIVAIGGSCGLALGLAIQGGLSNIAGGIMIIIFKPFKVGDYIETINYSGYVKEIFVFHTILKTIDNKIITIPNGELSNNAIINYSSMKERMLDLEINISYDNDIDKVREILLDIANNNELVIKDKEILVKVKNHVDNSIIMAYRMWVNNNDYWDLKFDILEEVKKKFDKNKITIPYNQLDVHISK